LRTGEGIFRKFSIGSMTRKKKSTAKKSKKDACYHKVKASYKVFPSAYASGAIAKCRKRRTGKK
jgi:hypothetical protein